MNMQPKVFKRAFYIYAVFVLLFVGAILVYILLYSAVSNRAGATKEKAAQELIELDRTIQESFDESQLDLEKLDEILPE